jgi:hypothetical protein
VEYAWQGITLQKFTWRSPVLNISGAMYVVVQPYVMFMQTVRQDFSLLYKFTGFVGFTMDHTYNPVQPFGLLV